MVRFRWKSIEVEEAIHSLRRRHKRKAIEAWQYLEEHAPDVDITTWEQLETHAKNHPSQSAYMLYIMMHKRFLQRYHNDLSKFKRTLPRRFVERVGLETALWPHLYPRIGMCESYVRSQDQRRIARTLEERQRKRREENLYSSDDDGAASGSGKSDTDDSDAEKNDGHLNAR